MKKAAVTIGLILVVLAAIVVFKTYPVRSASAGAQVTNRAAETLESKIQAIKKAETDTKNRPPSRVEISEAELESYVMVYLRKDIPVDINSVRVQLTPGVIATDAKLTIPNVSTGNPLVDALVNGTHNIHIGGKLTAARGEGKFDLQSVTVDGIPVPNILIDTLIQKYAKPKYPEVDLKEPFELPWGIEAIDIGLHKATVTY